MTATDTPNATLPPRALIRGFWATHKAVVRLSGGRVGLWRPRKGKRFGTMGLQTVGRRSGNRRLTIVGYFEDGPNLVTLAMNGWAEADPAWWLNLKSEPHATVLLSSGAQRVIARSAEGAERERLWATFKDYPGWGDDINALSRRRTRPTTVVVLEPRIPLGKSDADQPRLG